MAAPLGWFGNFSACLMDFFWVKFIGWNEVTVTSRNTEVRVLCPHPWIHPRLGLLLHSESTSNRQSLHGQRLPATRRTVEKSSTGCRRELFALICDQKLSAWITHGSRGRHAVMPNSLGVKSVSAICTELFFEMSHRLWSRVRAAVTSTRCRRRSIVFAFTSACCWTAASATVFRDWNNWTDFD